MGLAVCLLFGIIGAWITRAIQPSLSKGGLKALLITGIAAGFAGCFIGIAIGWGDIRMFNLYDVLLSMVFAAFFVLVLSKVIAFKTAVKPSLEQVPRI